MAEYTPFRSQQNFYAVLLVKESADEPFVEATWGLISLI
jgi:hypothetical protein